MTNLSYPYPIGLNAQAIINVEAGGNCNGGDPAKVYEYAYSHGIPDSTCEQYTASNLSNRRWENFDLCRDCYGPAPTPDDDGLDNCYKIPFTHYYVSDYYYVVGADKMKAELATHGPISCGI